MPRYGWTMTEGKIVQWLKKEGEEVRSGDPLLVIESEKTQIEVEAEASGVLRRILAPEGASVPVTQPIAIIGMPDEELPQVKVSASTAPVEASAQAAVVAEESKVHEVPERVRISPRAKRLAEKHGIDLKHIRGTGPDGLIVLEDVMKPVESACAATQPGMEHPAPGGKIALTGRRKVIADRMAASSRSAAAVTITMEADVSDAAELLRKLRQERGAEITYTDLVAKAVAKGLQEHPLLNSVWQGDQVLIPSDINLGIAVADQNGLIVPVIKNAEEKSLQEIAETRADIVKRVSEGRLPAEEAVGSTFTISNLGMYGVSFFTPIMNYPENAILGVGQLAQKPVAIGGQISIRSMMPLSLSFDHRVIDGAPAALFLGKLKELLENPALLL
jgi:pyruvate dehydrogenase E2 component (dihydrolipoamide acetyltransferase)